jgi:hypothetical protein
MTNVDDDVDDDVDLDVDLDSSVELDGSEAIRRRLTPPLTSTSPCCRARSRLAAQDRSASNVEGGLNIARRRQPQRSGSTTRSTSKTTNANSKARDGSADDGLDAHGHVNLDDGPQPSGRRLWMDPSEETS